MENSPEEIAQAEEEGVDPIHLKPWGLGSCAEALVSMCEARVKLAEVAKTVAGAAAMASPASWPRRLAGPEVYSAWQAWADRSRRQRPSK